MKINPYNEMPLGRIFGMLTKKYVGLLAQGLKDSPIERYFYPLYVIGKNSGKISQQELASCLLIDKVSVVRIIDVLEEKKLIVRKNNPKDRRQHLLSTTKTAEPWLKIIANNIQQTNAQFLACMDDETQKSFKAGITTLVEQTLNLPHEDFEVFYKRKSKKNDKKA